MKAYERMSSLGLPCDELFELLAKVRAPLFEYHPKLRYRSKSVNQFEIEMSKSIQT